MFLESFLGIVVLGHEIRYEKHGRKERSLFSELLLSNVYTGRTQALFILTKYIYHTEKKDLFLPRGSYSLARLFYFSILVFCVGGFQWAGEMAQCVDCFLSKPEDLTLDSLQKGRVWQCKCSSSVV